MADPSKDPPSRPKSVREKVLYSLKVDIKYGDELRDGISKCLEEVLGVSKDTLSIKLLNDFNVECKQMYDYLPGRMKKFARNKFVMVKKSVAFFSKKIELVEAPEADPEADPDTDPNVKAADPQVDVG